MYLTRTSLALSLQSFLHRKGTSLQALTQPFLPASDFLDTHFSALPYPWEGIRSALAQTLHLWGLPEEASRELACSASRKDRVSDFVDKGLLDLADCDVFFMRTSGSTGAPDEVRVPRELYWQEADEMKFLPRCDAVVSAVPFFHAFGLTKGLFFAEMRQIPCLQVQAMPGSMLDALREGCCFLAVPYLWEHLLPFIDSLPPSVTLLSAGAPLPEDVARAYERKGSPIIELYGSTQTGSLGWRVWPETSFELHQHLERKGEGLVRRMPDGRICPVDAQDHLSWHDERRFSLLGRKDKAVMVTGINVHPGAVERCIGELSCVRECAVRLDATHRKGRLKLFFVPADGISCAEAKAEIASFCRARLTVAERPVRMTCGTALPRNDMGKLVDWDE